VRGGMFGGTRLLVLAEEHGQGKQLVRVRTSPKGTRLVHALVIFLALLSLFAAVDGGFTAAFLIGLFAALIALRAFLEAGYTSAAVLHAIDHVRQEEDGFILSPKNGAKLDKNDNYRIETNDVQREAEPI